MTFFKISTELEFFADHRGHALLEIRKNAGIRYFCTGFMFQIQRLCLFYIQYKVK